MRRNLLFKVIMMLSFTLAAALHFNIAYAAGARDFLSAGKKSFEANNFDQALKQLNQAIAVGTLASKFASEAHYYRGRTFSKKGEPARGIVDFNRALFFKKLPNDLRVRILRSRAQAYKSVGLTSQAQADISAASAIGPNTPSTVASTRTRKANQGRTAQVNSQPSSLAQGWGASVSTTQTSQQKSQRTSSRSNTNPKPTVSAQPKPAEVRPQQPQRPQQSQAQQRSPLAIMSSEPKPAKQPKRAEPKSNSAIQGWQTSENSSENNYVTGAAPRQVSYTRQNLNQLAVSESGRYRLQLAAVSSQQEAARVWSTLSSKYRTMLAGQTPLFQRVTVNQKTVYRIQIGPFAEKAATERLCASYKSQGLDCFMVTQ